MMTTLMFVSTLLLLLVIADGYQRLGCSYRGRSYDNGETFLGSNRCTKLWCENGEVQPTSIRCAYNGVCYKVGEGIRAGQNGCILYRCQGNEQFMADSNDPFRCTDAFNRCKKCDG